MFLVDCRQLKVESSVLIVDAVEFLYSELFTKQQCLNVEKAVIHMYVTIHIYHMYIISKKYT